MVGLVLTILSMAVLTWKGATAKEALASEVIADVPHWVKAEKLPPAAVPGAKLFAVAGCTACHTYLGAGGSQLGAPDLTAIGTRHLGIDFQIRHLKCPSCVNPGSPMPKFASSARNACTSSPSSSKTQRALGKSRVRSCASSSG